MSGIFPGSGVSASEGTNTIPDAQLPPNSNCLALWYSSTRCTPRFDPAAQNAVMSEILNAIKALSGSYDCNRLDNLALALNSLYTHELRGEQSFVFADHSFPATAVDLSEVEQQVFTIPNSGSETIWVMLMMTFSSRIQLNIGGASTSYNVGCTALWDLIDGLPGGGGGGIAEGVLTYANALSGLNTVQHAGMRPRIMPIGPGGRAMTIKLTAQCQINNVTSAIRGNHAEIAWYGLTHKTLN